MSFPVRNRERRYALTIIVIVCLGSISVGYSALQARGIAVAFSIMAGKHDRVYWRAHTPDYLQFYRHALK